MEKKKDKSTSPRLKYHMQQLTPVAKELGLMLLTASCIGYIGYKVPSTSRLDVETKITQMNGIESSMKQLNSSKRSLVSEQANYQDSISQLTQKRSNEGSLRVYVKDLSAYCRYIESVASKLKISIVDIKIDNENYKVEYIVLGDYGNIVNFFNALETREIYYIENFSITPSLANSGFYAKFTANFNLEQSLTDRYSQYSKDLTNKSNAVDSSSSSQNNISVGEPTKPSVELPQVDQSFQSVTTEEIINGQLDKKEDSDSITIN